VGPCTAPTLAPVLLLLDIDGTLVRGATDAHQRSLEEAIRDVFGAAPSTPPTDVAGRTDRWIMRDMLSREPVDASEVDERMDELCASAARAYARLCEGSLADTVLPGVRDGLRAFDDAGHRLALVTGNLEPIARLKLGRAGLGGWLDGVPGGFASDHELRARLPGIARQRAGNVPREEAVVIGDTPLDVACAQADGVRCIAVTTGWFSAAELLAAGADAVARDLVEVAGLV
jgi:phosphoglycolate phosphatase